MSLYPENPAGQTFISQDTYASAGIALSGLGGGGGSVPANANITVSTLTVNGTGEIYLVNADDGVYDSVPISFQGSATNDIQIFYSKLPNTLTSNSTFGLLVANTLSTGETLMENLGVGSLNVGGIDNDTTSLGASIEYSNATSTLSLKSPEVGISSLVGVSSINGTEISAFTGAVPADLAVSSLTVNGANFGNISLEAQPGLSGYSAPILFYGGSETEDVGVLQMEKGSVMSLGPVSTQSGLVVSAFSTVFGQLQPLIAEKFLILGNNNDGSFPGAEIDYTNTTSTLSMYAPNVSVPSLVNLSSINATPFFAPRSGIFFMPPGTTTGYYDIPNPPAGITSNAVVMCTLTRPDGISQNWIVNSGVVQGGGAGTNWYIEVVMASSVVDDNTAVAWDLIAPTCTPGVAGTVPT